MGVLRVEAKMTSDGLINVIARLIVGVVMWVIMPILCTYVMYLIHLWLNAPLIAMVINLAGFYIIFTLVWFVVLGLAIEDS
jgi:hypothetical protein